MQPAGSGVVRTTSHQSLVTLREYSGQASHALRHHDSRIAIHGKGGRGPGFVRGMQTRGRGVKQQKRGPE